MSAYGTFSPYCATPRGLANTVGAAHTAFATWQGCRDKPPAPLPQSWWRLQPSAPSCYAVASQALTGFQLRPLRLVLLPPRRWRGVKGDEVVHFTLDALESTPTLTVGVGG